MGLALPNYECNKYGIKNLVGLIFTIRTILDYKRSFFRSKGLVATAKIEDGHCFIPYLKDLVEKEYLSTSGNHKVQYHVNDWDSLKRYYDTALMFLTPYDSIDEELAEIRQI